MTRQRPISYCWPSWVADLIAGDKSCWWAGHYRAHWQGYPKLESGDFDLVKWRAEHAFLLQRIADRYRADGYTCYLEDENHFSVKGKVAILGGKPDLIAVRGDEAVILDAKAGQKKDAHVWQVLIYLMIVPATDLKGQPVLPHVAECGTFRGAVEYGDGSVVDVPWGELATAQSKIVEAIRRVASKTAPPTSPSWRECSRCDLADCADRVAEEPAPMIVNGMF